MTCNWCGATLATTNRRARYCSASCRGHAHRHGPRVVPLADRRPSGDGPVTTATVRRLRELGVSETDDLARAALRCAREIDAPTCPPGALAPLTRSLRDVLTYLTERQETTDD